MKNYPHNNYRGLIIAGPGAVGRAVLHLGDDLLRSFEEVVLIDRDPAVGNCLAGGPGCFLPGDITDSAWLEEQLRKVAKPALFVNLCAGIDNVKIRKVVAGFNAAYIDSCCCAPDGSREVRFSRMMSYTRTAIASDRPQWLCWGINPGLVELVTRSLMRCFADQKGDFDVTVYEHDQLVNGDESRVAVGWCPDALIEEVMQSPALCFEEGRPVEPAEEGSRKVIACWDGEPVHSRLVGHEDIWNIGMLPQVRNASFVYGLHPKVMQVFEQSIDTARKRLYVPSSQVEVFGLERVAVAVRNRLTGKERVLIWEEDHHRIWQRFKLNAVQYQTGKSILLALMLLQHSRYGCLRGTYCAADLPILFEDWRRIESFMQDLAINFAAADDLDLHLCACPPTGSHASDRVECCCL